MPIGREPTIAIVNTRFAEVVAMYTVAVQRELIAQHFLIGGDFGPENHPHSHRYRVEVRLTGRRLDAHGFLVDIDEVSALLSRLLEGYRDRSLNHLPDFQGLNPSIEHLCRILCHRLAGGLHGRNLAAVTVQIWESDVAWAAYTEEMACA
jgi:6-pyruvoyltetrahydropterin/6-carboxytetrahydropterin synthase